MATKSSGSGSKRQGATGRSSGGAADADKNVEAFRDALERSVSLSRERIQAVVDEAFADLERLLEQVRGEVGSRAKPARRQATRAAGRAVRAARDAADPALAEADRIRRRAGVGGGSPITAYDQLTANQVNTRLKDLSPAELRKVRKQEEKGKARKTVLAEIDRRLES